LNYDYLKLIGSPSLITNFNLSFVSCHYYFLDMFLPTILIRLFGLKTEKKGVLQDREM